MKICITSEGKDLEANVDPRFGRCAYFVFYDTETEKVEYVSNENAAGMGGVGIQNGQMMAEKGVEVLLTGNLGPNAAGVLQQAGIKAITGVGGSVRDAIENFKKGLFKETDNAARSTVPSHFGTGSGKK